jgi:hypothetical protein
MVTVGTQCNLIVKSSVACKGITCKANTNVKSITCKPDVHSRGLQTDNRFTVNTSSQTALVNVRGSAVGVQTNELHFRQNSCFDKILYAINNSPDLSKLRYEV